LETAVLFVEKAHAFSEKPESQSPSAARLLAAVCYPMVEFNSPPEEHFRIDIAFTPPPAHISIVMPLLESTLEVPLLATEDGTIRIAGTRVSLDSVLHHYQQGATAEEIALRFPALRLADIHSCLAYFLNRSGQVEEYLARQRQQANDLQNRISADPSQQQGITQMRERIKRRQDARQKPAS
jgi:uncharacterized protein (DUF433 family)